ncbi:MAG TPA: arginine--tRNA ligase [Planctomycetaceae bacterium]|nr:arginine--tRNA ligase [Blastopirellula sp.]HAY79644.1 arginine--tRNA ligase [Planctomycetaceae bacterium]
MNPLQEIRSRFAPVLGQLVDDVTPLLEMIKPAQNPDFGDYQANCAMPLKAQLNKPPRDIANEIAAQVQLDDFCEPLEVAGPGFINIRLKREWITSQLTSAAADERLGVAAVSDPKTYVIDYSSPNVAKPMHVGHIRSTVIGDALCRTLRFLGHRVISDNHIGDWGTQFGMIIYGYKHFCDQAAYQQSPVPELSRLYRLVNQLADYHANKARLPEAEQQLQQQQQWLSEKQSAPTPADKAQQKKLKKELKKLQSQVTATTQEVASMKDKIASVESNPKLHQAAEAHPHIATAVLEETANLHAGTEDNRKLWDEFLPACRDEMQRVFQRLDVKFDYEHGESFYHGQLADVISNLKSKELSQVSDGAVCVFLEGYDAPMIVQKKDGAYLYATTDLATIDYRMEHWNPDVILYVVDHRQSEHFEKLFAVAKLLGHDHVDMRHISFGTVLGPDGKPFKTRAGDAAGLESLLDEAVAKAYDVVANNDDSKPKGAELSEEERRTVANVVGHGAIKYSDLSHNRTSDYKFVAEQMVQLEGNTAAYMQYSYARTRSIFRKGGIEIDDFAPTAPLMLESQLDQRLALQLLKLEEAISDVVVEYRPNQLTDYLFALAQVFNKFFHDCPVLQAESESLKASRLVLCLLTGRAIRLGLDLLGIDVVERM